MWYVGLRYLFVYLLCDIVFSRFRLCGFCVCCVNVCGVCGVYMCACVVCVYVWFVWSVRACVCVCGVRACV